jgi:hypothetical protein
MISGMMMGDHGHRTPPYFITAPDFDPVQLLGWKCCGGFADFWRGSMLVGYAAQKVAHAIAMLNRVQFIEN